MFWKKKNAPAETLIREVDKHFREINLRFSRIEQALEHVRSNPTQITIKNVHIHQPVVEKMEYRLDSLDINQLSGSLNLGNNFGAKTNPNSSFSIETNERPKTDTVTPSVGRRPTKTNQPSRSSGDEIDGLVRTETGYRLIRE
ncbi:spore germination protein GerPC [Cohnella terricola]|uniref:Uncharacterized protein n=1 Tax=Cohnella terricola TaxID=1289167 RepID=A0A559JQ99_9BACL|nr:spore germination protein GerPC [Cohnella terricola]TVY02055.1 hypothetical protein FPZ45_06330 [Cohnella terricola]